MADAGTQAAAGDAPTVTARVDRATCNVGDPVIVTVMAIGPRALPINLPATLDLGPFSLLERNEEEKDLGDGRMSHTFTLKVAAYEPGEIEVPGIAVTYLGKGGAPKQVVTAPLPIKVASLLANEPDPAPKEDAAPVTVMQENRWPYYVAAGLGAAVLGGALALVLRRRMLARKNRRPPPPPRPPHEVAMERLDKIGAALAEGQDLRPVYFELSETIRVYLGGRWGFDGAEMTIEEISVELRKRATRERMLIEIEAWLGATDLVKFAKVTPTLAEARGILEDAIRIVESTRLRPQVETSSPEGGPS